MAPREYLDFESIRATFHWRRLGNEGLLLNLTTTDVFTPDALGADILDMIFSAMDVDACLKEVSRVIEGGTDTARNLIDDFFRSAERASTIFDRSEGDYSLDQDAGEICMRLDGIQIMSYLKKTREIVWTTDKWSKISPYRALLAIVPKLMALDGYLVLHASAFLHKGAVVAAAGPSGAGKTTLVRNFAAEGTHLVSEDFLIATQEDDSIAVYADAEERVRRWAREMTTTMTPKVNTRVSLPQFLRHSVGWRLREIWFVSAVRRTGVSIELKRAGDAETASALLGNFLLGPCETEGLRRAFDTACDLSLRVNGFWLSSPASLAGLAEAVHAYIRKETT